MAMIVHDGHKLEFEQEMVEVTLNGMYGATPDTTRRVVPGLRYYYLDGQAISEAEAQAFLDSIPKA